MSRADFDPGARRDGQGGGGRKDNPLAGAIKLGSIEVGLRPNQRYRKARTQEAVRLGLEVGKRPYQFSVSLGSITEADADAIAIPSNGGFQLAMGAVENALIRDMDSIRSGSGDGFFANTEAYARSARDLGQRGLRFATAVAFPNEEMTTRGIKHVVMMNSLPERGEQLDAAKVQEVVKNALIAAEQVGATSLATPEIGTGLLAAFGASTFRTREEAWIPVITGFLEYGLMAQRGEARGTVTRLSLVTYASPSDENAGQVAEVLGNIVDPLKRRLQAGNN